MGRQYRIFTHRIAIFLAVFLLLFPFYLAAIQERVGALSNGPEIVSLQPDGNLAKDLRHVTLSRDGRYAAFVDRSNFLNQGQVVVRDLQTGTSTRELNAWYDVREVAITDGGRYLYFTSKEDYIDPYFPRVGGSVPHTFVKDRLTNKTFLVEVSSNNTSVWNPTLRQRLEPSDDGKMFAGQCSYAPVKIMCIRNIETKTTLEYVDEGVFEQLSGNGKYLFFKHNDGRHLKRDTATGQDTDLSSFIPTEAQVLAVSSDGNFVISKTHSSSQPTTIFRLDTASGTSEGAGSTLGDVQLSGDGNVMMLMSGSSPSFVQFTDNGSGFGNYAQNQWGQSADASVFLGQDSFTNVMSFNASKVAFLSAATNLGCPVISGEVCGYIGSMTGPAIIGEDNTSPQLQAINPSPIIKDECDMADFTVTASDDSSGVTRGEFNIEDGTLIEDTPHIVQRGLISNNGGVLTGAIRTGLAAGNYTVKSRVQDAAGNWSGYMTTQLQVVNTTTCPDPQPDVDPNRDSIKPVLAQPAWTANPKGTSQQSTMTVVASDDNSGVTWAEGYICENDPGVGGGFELGYDDDKFSLFVDESIPEGTYNICLRTFDRAGNISDATQTVLYVGENFDITPPAVTGSPDRAANVDGWYNSPVAINWSSVDPAPSSGLPTIPSPRLANLEGINSYTSGESCDPLNNCATGVYEVKLDTQLPSGIITNSNTPIMRFKGQTMTGMVSDFTSGVREIILSADGNVLTSDADGGLALSCNTNHTSCAWSATAGRLQNGNRLYVLTVTDRAGNVFTVTKRLTVI